MKNRKVIVIMGLFTAILSLFGCNNMKNEDTHINYLSISQNHMCFDECYSFSISKEDEVYKLSADCSIDGERINIEGKKIKKSDFKFFIELDEKYDFYKYIKENPTKRNSEFACDETTNCFLAGFDDVDKILTTNCLPECYGEIYNNFKSLVQKYKN